MSSEVSGQVNMNAINAANDWLYHDVGKGEWPDYPGGEVMVEAVASKMRQWKEWSDKGMDIVAHSILDDIATFIEKLKELT